MKGEDKFLANLFDGAQTRFLIPVYQRNYDWKYEQCQRLFDDIEDIIDNHRPSHFFGSIVSKATRRMERTVIDGQQRITSCYLFLVALMHLIQEQKIQCEDHALADQINERYLTDKWHKGDLKLKLKLIKDDQNAFEALFANNESKLVKGSRVTDNYLHFRQSLSASKHTAEEFFYAFEALQVIDIMLEKDDDEQLIFECLNSTGLDLSEGDKVRNFVLMGLEYEQQELFYHQYWNEIEKNTNYDVSAFIRHYLAAKTKRVLAINRIYEEFKAFAKNRTLFPNIEVLLIELLRYSEHFKTLSTCQSGSHHLDPILRRFALLDMSVVYPYLLCLMEYKDEGNVDDRDVASCIAIVETYIFRRWVCRIPTSSLNKIFVTLHSEILKCVAEGTNYIDGLVYILSRKEGSGLFPRDKEFIEGLTSRDFYQIHNIKFYLYDRLENGDSRERVQIVDNLENGIFSVEHVMPQTLSKNWIEELGSDYKQIHEQWVNKLANLTLTGYNSEYSNSRFIDKRDTKNGFKDSGLRLNQFIASCDRWNVDELMTRQSMLEERFLKLWPLPTTDFKLSTEIHEEASLADEDFQFTGRKLAAYTFHGSRYTVKTWAEMLCGVIAQVAERAPSLIHHLVEQESGVGRYFTQEEKPHSHQLLPGAYLGYGNSTETKIWMLRHIFDQTNTEQTELTFELYRQNKEDNEVTE